MRNFVSAVCAAVSLFAATPSVAAVIQYTVSSTASGSLNGQSFSGDFSLTTVSDSATRKQCSSGGVPLAGCFFVVNSSAVVKLGSLGEFTLTNPSISFVNNPQNVFGFSEVYPPNFSLNSFAFVNQGGTPGLFSTWNGVSDLGPAATTLNLNSLFRAFVDTSGGRLAFTLAGPSTPATFSASVRAGAVPEPATWMMAILGFGAIGTAMRRRRALSFA